MINIQLSDAMADARAEGRKTVTRRLSCKWKAGDVVYNGEALMRAGAGATWYRRDKSIVQDFSEPLPGKVMEWTWQRSVLPARFCPMRAARLFSLVRDVRQEPLHAMTESEALLEGVVRDDAGHFSVPGSGMGTFNSALECFAALWDVINGQRAPCHSNPAVWRIDLGNVLTRDEALRLTGIADRAARLGRVNRRAA